MTFQSKLKSLVGRKNRAAISRSAGLPQNTLANIINSGTMPRLDTAFALATALDADVSWLADKERQGGPFSQLLTADVRRQFRAASERFGEDVIIAAALRLYFWFLRSPDAFAGMPVIVRRRIEYAAWKFAADAAADSARLGFPTPGEDGLLSIYKMARARLSAQEFQEGRVEVPSIIGAWLQELEEGKSQLEDEKEELEREKEELEGEKEDLERAVSILQKQLKQLGQTPRA